MAESKGNIVVVEDDPTMSLALTRVLKAAGFRARIFDSAEELLDHPAEVANALCLILDVHLPGLSGFELQRQLREWGATPPTIFITGDEKVSFPNGHPPAVACLCKPFSRHHLLVTIYEAMGRDSEVVKRF